MLKTVGKHIKSCVCKDTIEVISSTNSSKWILILEVGKTTNTLDNERSRVHKIYENLISFVGVK